MVAIPPLAQPGSPQLSLAARHALAAQFAHTGGVVAHPALALECVFAELLEAERTRRLALAALDSDLGHGGSLHRRRVRRVADTGGWALYWPLLN